jgi:predicted DNA repair protein MutK
MAGASLLALIDDIATVLDDVAVMTKVAARKTAGVLGDDLALNAQQVSGVRAERELPVVWAVAKGSAKNKVILLPAAFLISAFAPWLILPLLMLGGAFLCYEGVEKVVHSLFHKEEKEAEHKEMLAVLTDPGADMMAFEAKKVKGAIRTDFILSAEIIVIALGTVKEAAFITQVATVTAIAVLMTVGVYSLVAGIVKLDDVGYYLQDAASGIKRRIGRMILRFCPFLMKTLSVVGTAAMFLVGGGILVHGVPVGHDVVHYAEELVAGLALVGGLLKVLMPMLVNAAVGVVAGAIVLLGVSLIKPKAVSKAA